MLKTIIRKLKKKKKTQRLKGFKILFFCFKLKRLTQNPKTELKRLWVRLDGGTK